MRVGWCGCVFYVGCMLCDVIACVVACLCVVVWLCVVVCLVLGV